MTLPKGYDKEKSNRAQDKKLGDGTKSHHTSPYTKSHKAAKIIVGAIAAVIVIALVWYLITALIIVPAGIQRNYELVEKAIVQQQELIDMGCEPLAFDRNGIVTAWKNC
jgi:hypothetical protein